MLPGSPKKTRSPGRRSPRSTGEPLEAENWASVTRGIWMPAFAYAHCTRPEQSNPVCGVEPPQWYLVPVYFCASASAASAFGPAPAPAARGGGHGVAGHRAARRRGSGSGLLDRRRRRGAAAPSSEFASPRRSW